MLKKEKFIDLPVKIFTLEGKLLTREYLKKYKGTEFTKCYHQYVSIDSGTNLLSVMYKTDDGECLDEKLIVERIKYNNKSKWKKKK